MIKQYIKWVISILVMVIALCALAGCNKKSKIQLLDDLNAQPEYLSFFSDEDVSDKDVTKYWIDRFVEKYNKKVYINFEIASYYAEEGLSYRELLERRLESSAPDDLYIINAEDVLEFEKKGYWMDLSKMNFVNNLSEAALYQSSYNGKVFSIPLSFTGFGFAWNVDLLKEHGLAIPQNLEEFLNTCEKLKKEGVLPYGANKGYALTVPAMCVGFSKLYGNSAQDELISALNSGEMPISSYMREGFEFLSLMIERGYLDPEQALETTPNKEDVELFLAGKCAFICIGLSDFPEEEEKSFKREMTGLPVLSDGCIAVYGASNRLCVNPNSNHLDTICEFIEMLGTPEALMESALVNGAMSSGKINKVTEFPSEEKMIELLQQPNQIPNQDFALHFNTWENIRDIARELCNGASIDQACAMLDEKQKIELKEYGESSS